MKWARPLSARKWVWVVPVMLLVLLAGHGVILYYVSSHVSLSATGLSVAIVLLLIKHMGLFSRCTRCSSGAIRGTGRYRERYRAPWVAMFARAVTRTHPSDLMHGRFGGVTGSPDPDLDDGRLRGPKPGSSNKAGGNR
jgi:hypothetical protein